MQGFFFSRGLLFDSFAKVRIC